MLEVIAIITLGKSIGKIATDKGLKPLKYVLTMVLMWIGFEVAGSVVGTLMFGEGMVIYLFALLGAALGGFISYQIAKNASPKSAFDTEDVLDADLRKPI